MKCMLRDNHVLFLHADGTGDWYKLPLPLQMSWRLPVFADSLYTYRDELDPSAIRRTSRCYDLYWFSVWDVRVPVYIEVGVKLDEYLKRGVLGEYKKRKREQTKADKQGCLQ